MFLDQDLFNVFSVSIYFYFLEMYIKVPNTLLWSLAGEEGKLLRLFDVILTVHRR